MDRDGLSSADSDRACVHVADAVECNAALYVSAFVVDCYAGLVGCQDHADVTVVRR